MYLQRISVAYRWTNQCFVPTEQDFLAKSVLTKLVVYAGLESGSLRSARKDRRALFYAFFLCCEQLLVGAWSKEALVVVCTRVEILGSSPVQGKRTFRLTGAAGLAPNMSEKEKHKNTDWFIGRQTQLLVLDVPYNIHFLLYRIPLKFHVVSIKIHSC